MISRNFDWNIMTFAKLNHIGVKCCKVITFIKCINGMLPITIPFKGLIINKGPFI